MVSVFTSGYVNTETILHFFNMKKIRKKRPEKNKERNQLRPMQTTRNKIAFFVSDWLIR